MTLIQSSGTAALALGSIGATWGQNTSNGNMVVVGVCLTNAATIGTVTSVSDSQGNTYVKGTAGTTDAAITVVNAPILGNILVNSSLVSTAYQAVFDTSPYGPLGPKWGIGVVNQSGAALGGTESNHLKNYIGVNRRTT